MKIVYILNSLRVGGAERLTARLAEGMAERGHRVLAMTLMPAEAGELECGVERVSLGITGGPWSAIVGAVRAVRLLRGFRPDVIHTHGFQGNMLGRLAGVLTPGARVISTIHNVYEGGRGRMLAYRMTDGFAARTVAVCEAAARRFESLGAVRKCGVVRNAIEVAGFEPDAGRRAAVRAEMGVGEEFVWLAVGRDAPAKDYPGMLGAFGQVRELRPDARLWIAGAERRGGGEDGVSWLGMREDVAALMDGADGFVLSSRWEGMPLAVAEAMAMGKPVVATDVGGVRELVGDCGVLVGDVGGLAGAMVEVMGRPIEERAELGRRARRRVLEGFDLSARVEEWEGVYGVEC